jgi:hypothetical protein
MPPYMAPQVTPSPWHLTLLQVHLVPTTDISAVAPHLLAWASAGEIGEGRGAGVEEVAMVGIDPTSDATPTMDIG